jgi:hypothetical protein
LLHDPETFPGRGLLRIEVKSNALLGTLFKNDESGGLTRMALVSVDAMSSSRFSGWIEQMVSAMPELSGIPRGSGNSSAEKYGLRRLACALLSGACHALIQPLFTTDGHRLTQIGAGRFSPRMNTNKRGSVQTHFLTAKTQRGRFYFSNSSASSPQVVVKNHAERSKHWIFYLLLQPSYLRARLMSPSATNVMTCQITGGPLSPTKLVVKY